MVFNENETLISLFLVSIPAILSSYFFFIREKKKTAIVLLLFSAFLLRILLITLDPFLHEWDERFHALVAKNMTHFPFTPMLFTKQLMAFNPLDWGSYHVWVHKQPLFLWQMALSMKIFGVNLFAMRLPSAILGTIMVWLNYDISRKWISNENVSFITAFIAAFAYYPLELTSGLFSLDHNDLCFIFYMTCCIWGFTRYIHSNFKMSWAVLIGLFAGLAILNKWLVGLLIFGGWGLYLIISLNRYHVKYYLHIFTSIIVSCFVFLPWQFYILNAFPIESSHAFEYNRMHIYQDLGHPGNALFHIKYLLTAYNKSFVAFLVIGLISIFYSKTADKKLTIAFISMILVIYAFFSIFVATKMPAFVYPVSSLMLILIAYGIFFTFNYLFDYLNLIQIHKHQLLLFIILIASYLSLKPGMIGHERSISNQVRNNKMTNTSIYKKLSDSVTSKYVILNCRPYENIELMFFKDCLAYHWYPLENTLDSLQSVGYKFAAFEYPGDQQQLPNYIVNDSTILIINEPLK